MNTTPSTIACLRKGDRFCWHDPSECTAVATYEVTSVSSDEVGYRRYSHNGSYAEWEGPVLRMQRYADPVYLITDDPAPEPEPAYLDLSTVKVGDYLRGAVTNHVYQVTAITALSVVVKDSNDREMCVRKAGGHKHWVPGPTWQPVTEDTDIKIGMQLRVGPNSPACEVRSDVPGRFGPWYLLAADDVEPVVLTRAAIVGGSWQYLDD